MEAYKDHLLSRKHNTDGLVVWVRTTSNPGDFNNGIAIAKALNPKEIRYVQMYLLPRGAPLDDPTFRLQFVDPELRGPDAYTSKEYDQNDVPLERPDVFIDSSQEDVASAIKLLDDRLPKVAELFKNTYTVKVAIADYPERMIPGEHADLRIMYPHQFDTLPQPGSLPANTQLHDLIPTRVTADSLAWAAAEAGADLKGFNLKDNKPAYAVVLGGRLDHNKELDVHDAEVLATKVAEAVKKTGGSVLVTTSPRTSVEASKALKNTLKKNLPSQTALRIYDYNESNGQNNPYLAMLGIADRIVTMDDSMSMASDIIASGKPLFIVPREPDKNMKTAAEGNLHQRYFDGLYDKGLAYSIDAIAEPLKAAPMAHNSAMNIAETIKRDLALQEDNSVLDSSPLKEKAQVPRSEWKR